MASGFQRQNKKTHSSKVLKIADATALITQMQSFFEGIKYPRVARTRAHSLTQILHLRESISNNKK